MPNGDLTWAGYPIITPSRTPRLRFIRLDTREGHVHYRYEEVAHVCIIDKDYVLC